MTGELKRCPFCGGKAEFCHDYREDEHKFPRNFWHVKAGCLSCEIDTGWYKYGQQEQRVISGIEKEYAETMVREFWNTRPIEDALQDEIAKLRERVAELEHAINEAKVMYDDGYLSECYLILCEALKGKDDE